MAETYCGKTCEACKQKETLSCPGCKVGPGRITGGDCRLAKCCREKGHPECSTCGFHQTCNTLRGREHMPEYRLKAIEAEKTIAAQIAERAPVLGKWIGVLFWLIIPNTIATLLANKTNPGWLSALYIPGVVLNIICSLAYGIILLRLASKEERYRIAGICMLVNAAMGVLTGVPGIAGDGWWTMIFLLIIAFVSPIAQLCEMTAHSIMLTGVDNKLADYWLALRKWYIIAYAVVLGGISGMAIPVGIPILGILIALTAVIGLAAIGIVKLVFQYITAKRFREYKIEED